MVKDIINLETLNMAELAGVVTIYPWYAQARMELCKRMAELGEGGWSQQRFAEEALYLGSRKLLSRLLESSTMESLVDTDLPAESPVPSPELSAATAPEEKTPQADVVSQTGAYLEKQDGGRSTIVVVGGDYFSQADYESAREDSDNFLAGLKRSEAVGAALENVSADDFSEFCTESLAEVYASQGYLDAAKEIYSKLSLRYPEKSVYFATLIEKIDKNI